MSYIKAYRGSFLKGDNTERVMEFVRAADIADILPVPNKQVQRKPGQELVWDLQAEGFRIFNYNNQIGNLEEIPLDESKLPRLDNQGKLWKG